MQKNRTLGLALDVLHGRLTRCRSGRRQKVPEKIRDGRGEARERERSVRCLDYKRRGRARAAAIIARQTFITRPNAAWNVDSRRGTHPRYGATGRGAQGRGRGAEIPAKRPCGSDGRKRSSGSVARGTIHTDLGRPGSLGVAWSDRQNRARSSARNSRESRRTLVASRRSGLNRRNL